ncbi:MAG: serine hydrolase [Prosthecobacter sp.]|uniref:serine hydrolase n=1 Tax=Prosthecobacter sp. TaxID=1965333 RepID=UPI0039003006
MKFVLLSLLITVQSLHARTLAAAAAQQAKELKAGCIVTGERIGDDVRFTISGKAPEAKNAPPEQIVFEIGSITKVFTGLLLAQAVVEKKVTLETTIGSLLDPKLKFADPRIAAITLKQLSTHTSGLPRLPANLAVGSIEDDPYANYDEKLLLAFLISAKLEGEGPYSCSYSNLGVGLLGHLLGKLWETGWEKAVVAKICLPLGLKDTAVHPEPKLPLATPHAGEKGVKPWNFDAVAGAGALRSTAADLMKFGEAMLHPEKTPLKDAFAFALQAQAEAPAMGGQIGLGLFLGKHEGEMIFSHDGGTGGYSASLQVIPSKETVLIALINNNSLSGSAVIAAMSDAKSATPQKQKEISLPVEMLTQYPGVYELDRDARFTVLLRDGKLWVNLTGQAFLHAFAKVPDRFFYKAVTAEIAFNRDKGVIQSLTLFQNGRELTAKRSSAAPPEYQLRTSKELQPYAGEYALMGLKKLKVTVQANTLFAQLEGQPSVPVFETTPDRFEYDVVKATLVFTRDDKQQINGLTLLQNGLALPAARVTSQTSDLSK